MTLSRTAIGLAVRSVREAAGMTLSDLAGAAGLTTSSLSRSENGLRAVEFAEVVGIAGAVGVSVGTFLDLAHTFERDGVAGKSAQLGKLRSDLNRLQRDAVRVAIEAKALDR